MQLRKKDKNFLKKYLTKKEYYSFNELAQNPPQADIYVTGSDQVWNSSYNKGIVFGFRPQTKAKNFLCLKYRNGVHTRT